MSRRTWLIRIKGAVYGHVVQHVKRRSHAEARERESRHGPGCMLPVNTPVARPDAGWSLCRTFRRLLRRALIQGRN